MLHSNSFFFSFEGKLIGFSGYLAFTFFSDSMLKREKNGLNHFCIEIFLYLLTTNKQTAGEKLTHTLAKLRCTGTLIGQKCPKIEVNWQVDPRFACRQNLSDKKMKSYANTPPFLSAFMCL